MLLVILIVIGVFLIILVQSNMNNKQMVQNIEGIEQPVILSDGNTVNAKIDISYLVVEPKKADKAIGSKLHYEGFAILRNMLSKPSYNYCESIRIKRNLENELNIKAKDMGAEIIEVTINFAQR